MHPLLRSFARRAALAASQRHGDCGSGRKEALPLIQKKVPAPEEVVQVRPRRGLDFTIGWTSVMFGVIIGHIALKFKQPPKTIYEMWEAHVQDQRSEANIGSCSFQGGGTSS